MVTKTWEDKERTQKRRWAFNSRITIGKPGNPMLERLRLIQTPLFGIYVHFIYREDLDRQPHDHPWSFWSLVLKGGYVEEVHKRPGETSPVVGNMVSTPKSVSSIGHRRFSFHHFPLHWAHRITSVQPGTVTLVLVGRKVRAWGFYEGNQWVHYREMARLEELRPGEGSPLSRDWKGQWSNVVASGPADVGGVDHTFDGVTWHPTPSEMLRNVQRP